ncbi:interferon-induced, double-stranded RNA-activated protein kinase isoform X2 [Etheostoma spectabile]|uniref:interferon-induced, double-stranded RNA-activated protein kinase isoform X2 n=1 Tax=Etheostoma spectabile TaxID=54343 RepID=UPI0013AF7970|nr:interferon-induced, double-stranded RNA-activated protein kinase-like isoform X2 [Etheostoma spectabile]
METGNYVSRLNEYVQKTSSVMQYEDLGSVGPDHMKTFTLRVVLNGKAYPNGVGKNKKEAKHNAAKNALEFLFSVEHQDSVDTTADENLNPTSAHRNEEMNPNVSDICNMTRRLSMNSKDSSYAETNYIGIVNHYCQKKKITHTFIEERRCGPPHDLQFSYKLRINNKEYPVGEGKSIKEAQQKAAQLAWDALQEQTDWDSKPEEEKYRCASSEPEEEKSDICEKITKDKGFTEDNFIGLVDHYCLKEKLIHDFILENKCGPPHDLQFSYKLVINNKEYPVGEGKSVKEAKQKAAQLAWSALQEQTDWDSKAAKDKNMGNNQNETSMQSRFTSEFEPMECLGSGGFGVVYKARHKLLEKDFAVKIVFCEEKALREVKTLSDLLHHNIVRYYTVWPEDSGYRWDSSAGSSAGSYSYSQSSIDNSSAKYLYIQMELCNTKTLKDWIDEKNNQSPQDTKRREESLSIAQQIVSGVEYIHSRKHIHRDLKPANILFGLDGEVKIGDFGLVTKDDDALMDRTENKGTPSYMAPEQRRKHYDRKVDIFALGLIYLELLWKVSTGHERRVVLDDARCQKLPNDFSKTFPQENHIIKLMLRENPEGRPDASQLKADLEKWAQTFSTKNVRQENATI